MKIHGIEFVGQVDNLDAGDVGLGNVPNTNCTVANNVENGTLPGNVLPPLSITSTYTASSEVEHLALTTEEGDVVVRTDESRTYINNGGTAGTMGDYTELLTPGDTVQSVNGHVGTVVLDNDDIGLGNVPNTDFTSAVGSNTTHRGLSNNPHGVDKDDVGLGNVINAPQVEKGGDTMTGPLIVSDHGTPSLAQVVNVCYGTGTPPAANTTTIGSIFIKYIA